MKFVTTKLDMNSLFMLGSKWFTPLKWAKNTTKYPGYRNVSKFNSCAEFILENIENIYAFSITAHAV